MKHLTPSEFVDLAEGTIAPARATHAEECEACRAQGMLMREALRAAGLPDVPEPSPLFWERFSARLREGVAAEQPRGARAWLRGRESLRLAAGLAVAVAVVSTFWLLRHPRPSHTPVPVTAAQTAPVSAPDRNADLDPSVDPGDVEVWAVLTAAAADIAIEDARAAGMKPHAAAVDRAVQAMSSAELNELSRLLQSELKRSGD